MTRSARRRSALLSRLGPAEGPTFLAHLTWTGSGSWSVGSCVDGEPVGYLAADELNAHSYVARISRSIGDDHEIGAALVAHARRAGVYLPLAPTF
jgi:hypothetical protein